MRNVLRRTASAVETSSGFNSIFAAGEQIGSVHNYGGAQNYGFVAFAKSGRYIASFDTYPEAVKAVWLWATLGSEPARVGPGSR